MNGIWVRTQERRRLVDCKDIEVLGDTVISNYDKDDYFKLGVYATHERALEVLDEIQEHIETRIIADELIIATSKQDHIQEEEYLKRMKKLSCVYEMPKE